MSESLERVFFSLGHYHVWLFSSSKAGVVSYSCQFKITIFHNILTHILPALWHLFFSGTDSWIHDPTIKLLSSLTRMNTNLLSFFLTLSSFEMKVLKIEEAHVWGANEYFTSKNLTGGFNMKIYQVLWCMSKYCRNKSRRAITWMLFFALWIMLGFFFSLLF